MGFYSNYEEKIESINENVKILSNLCDNLHNKIIESDGNTDLIYDLNKIQDQFTKLNRSITMGTMM